MLSFTGVHTDGTDCAAEWQNSAMLAGKETALHMSEVWLCAPSTTTAGCIGLIPANAVQTSSQMTVSFEGGSSVRAIAGSMQ